MFFPQENRDVLYRRLQRRADKLCFLIVAAETPRQQIDLERMSLRAEAISLFPEKLDLYDMVYESRFRRLWEQFREAN